MLEIPVSGETLELSYGHRVVQFPPATPGFTGVMTYTATDSREWIAFSDGVNCLPIFTGGDMSHMGEMY